ncbi:DNA helicase UvrD [Candidatus Pacearchaeota archaeon]|nr:MAG: DNA helicase UvrD [Candidatus Pacearchaeota archaeon]
MNKNYMITDLHIHSRFSRACSKNLTFENLVKWAKIKGLNLLGTGDFTHPVWFSEIKEKLIEKNGLYYYQNFPFIITGEISLIYTQGKGRRVHLLMLIPNIKIAEEIHAYLDKKGRRDYDGRPIFKISCEKFTEDMMKISKDIEIIPAHIWTPYFGVLGSKSGFDSLKEAFGEQLENIHAIETGISSDPQMNWKIRELNDKAIISFSDSHSFWPFRLGREATIFNKTDSYSGIINQIRNKSFISTIETDPAYGKYHWDGHSKCNFSCSPKETQELNGICPKCKSPLTIGVDYRVEALSDNNENLENLKPYYTLLPLHEIISLAFGIGMQSKKVWDIYNRLISYFENEFEILLNISKERFLEKKVNEKLIELILKNRRGKIKVKPGFDGVYGEALIEEQITLV